MTYQSVFKRYELKYLLTLEQKECILKAMSPYMRLDDYGKTIIRNIYFDTDTYRLIRHSIEKPTTYKEKLRIRSYNRSAPDDPVFVELKKKYKSVVYKRRLSMSESQAIDWICKKIDCGQNSQIAREIDYFLRFYETLQPRVLLSYEREAYYALDGSDFRITFDSQILCRENEITLDSDIWGTPILDDETFLMELKTSGGIPLWMTSILSKEKIYKTPFSKYGTAYQKLIYPGIRGGNTYD